jgi:trehalose 6-phosphate synthase
MQWTDTILQDLARKEFGAFRLVVVSNRQPYAHSYSGRHIVCERAISGMASALEPVLRACGGLWVAHGSGTADRFMVDDDDCCPAPPEYPGYVLKRVWLTKAEEIGFYDGFANEALWPLCHTVFTRPRFAVADWETYVRVNEKFARAVLAEIHDEPAIVWVQDYHFALLPRLLKEARPDLIVAQFWHIPWPHPDTFRVCPWKREILWGLLANDLLGFHIHRYCDNFLETAEKELRVAVDREQMAAVHLEGAETVVRPFPISTDFTSLSREVESAEVRQEARRLVETYRLHGRRVCVGIDRLDYTKGIPERLLAFARLLEQYPAYRRQVVFIQAGPESRAHLESYQALNEEVARLARDINARYGDADWMPVIFLPQRLSMVQVLALYRLAEVCVVSALHDGMNLVAKEYIAAKNDGNGMVVLSRFTGAALELSQALLINPYDLDAFTAAFAAVLRMSREERVRRMQALRNTVERNNVYRWAGEFLLTLASLRQDAYTALLPTTTAPLLSDAQWVEQYR